MKSIKLDVSNKNADELYSFVLASLDKLPAHITVTVCYEQEAW